jgi:hypothetical protein
MSVPAKPPALSPVAYWRLARFVVIAGFILMLGRYWHPFYGFTSFLQADVVTKASLPESLRDTPIFIHPEVGRYDGAYYAQIATNPALRDPALAVAVDDLAYRARRILLSAVAWVAGGGQPVAAVHAYAWLNVILWFILAALAWRIFPVTEGWRATLAWAGLVMAGGTMASVTLALTDLAALVLLAAALLLVERDRPAISAALLGLAGLARETALLGLGALLPGEKMDAGKLWRRGILFAVAVIPLAAWMAYLWSAVGPTGSGSENLAWPLTAWFGRWAELMRISRVEENLWLVAGGWLDCIALTVQMGYLLMHPQWRNPWWRMGLLFTALGLCLGPAVWEGLPGAASRVLLPLTLVFNVLACRRRAALLWLLCGNLSVFSGVWSFWTPRDPPPHTLVARTTWTESYLLDTDDRWQVAEWNNKWRWSWCSGVGGLDFRIWPWRPRVRVELQVRGVTPRALEVWQGQTRVWQGQIGDRPQWIKLPELPVERGHLLLELRSNSPAAGEGADNTARRISFACFDVRLAE